MCNGNYEGLDAELTKAGIDDASVARLPASNPLPTPALAPLRLRKQLRAHHWRTGLRKGVSGTKTGGRRLRPPVAAVSGSPWLPKTAPTRSAKRLLASLPRSQFVLPTGKTFAEVADLPGHLDLFSGSRGFARALANTTGRWVLTISATVLKRICSMPRSRRR